MRPNEHHLVPIARTPFGLGVSTGVHPRRVSIGVHVLRGDGHDFGILPVMAGIVTLVGSPDVEEDAATLLAPVAVYGQAAGLVCREADVVIPEIDAAAIRSVHT